MEREAEVGEEPVADSGDEGAQPIAVGTDDKGVVDIAAIVAAEHLALHEVVETAEMDVAEELAGEVANGEAAARRGVEEALRLGQPVPVGWFTTTEAAHSGGGEDDDPREVGEEVDIDALGPCGYEAAADLVGGQAEEEADDHVGEELPADVHKVAADVELEGEGGAGVVAALGADVPVESGNAVESTTAGNAAVGVGYGSPLEDWRGVGEVEVMDHAVDLVLGVDIPVHLAHNHEATPALWRAGLGDCAIGCRTHIGMFILSIWVAARIYRVGILWYGKKETPKELVKWFRQN